MSEEEKPRRNWLAFLPLIAFAALAAIFLVRLYAGDPTKLPSTLIGKPVPRFTLPALEGLMAQGQPVPGFSDANLRDGKLKLVNVFASWCAPCRDEHPLLLDLAKDPRITLLGINMKDNPENARRFLGQLGNPYAMVGTDESGRIAIDWGVYGVPETFLISGDGIILFKQIGPLTRESLKSTLEPEITKAMK